MNGCCCPGYHKRSQPAGHARGERPAGDAGVPGPLDRLLPADGAEDGKCLACCGVLGIRTVEKAQCRSCSQNETCTKLQAMVEREAVHRIMDELYDLGARAILVTDISNCRL